MESIAITVNISLYQSAPMDVKINSNHNHLLTNIGKLRAKLPAAPANQAFTFSPMAYILSYLPEAFGGFCQNVSAKKIIKLTNQSALVIISPFPFRAHARVKRALGTALLSSHFRP